MMMKKNSLAIASILSLCAAVVTTACVGDDETSTSSSSSGGSSGSSGSSGSTGGPVTPTGDDFDITNAVVGPLVQGATVDIVVTLSRNGFTGPITVSIPNLPTGVTSTPITIGEGATEGKVTLQAASTATQGTTDLTVATQSTDGKRKHDKKVPLLVRGVSGSLDTTFGNGTGSVTVNTAANGVWGVTIQPDGKAVLVIDSERDFVAYRLNADGTPDSTFGNTARSTADLRLENVATDDSPRGIALSPDGTIFMAGYTTQPSSKYATLRLNTTGKLDLSFNTTGYLISAYGPHEDWLGNVLANGIATQADGKPVLAAQIMDKNTGYDHPVLIRYKQNGAVDTDFQGGFPTSAVITANANERCYAVTVGSDGKIICGGESDPGGIGGSRMIAWRVDATGANDTAFHAGDGVAVVPVGSVPGGHARSVHALDQGRVLLVGESSADNTTAKAAIVQLTAAGAVDTAFGGGMGYVLFDWGTTLSNAIEPHSIVDQQGRIVVVASTGPTKSVAIARFASNGALDESFATKGKIVQSPGTDLTGATNVFVAQQADGRIVVATSAVPTATPLAAPKPVVFRYWP